MLYVYVWAGASVPNLPLFNPKVNASTPKIALPSVTTFPKFWDVTLILTCHVAAASGLCLFLHRGDIVKPHSY